MLEHGMSCAACGWFSPIKQGVCKGPMAQAVTSWQLKIWEQAQAGHRTSKTGRSLQ